MPDEYRIDEEGELVPVPKSLLKQLLEVVGVLPVGPLLRVGVDGTYEGPSRDSMAVAGSVDPAEKREAYRSLMEQFEGEEPEDMDMSEGNIIELIIMEDK